MRLLLSLIGFVLLLAVATAVWLLVQDKTWHRISTVRVEGSYHFVTKQQIAKAVKPYLNQGFFHVNVEAAQRALAQLPSVKSASIRRVWPDSIDVSVVERKGFAKWNDGLLMTEDGHFFKPRQAKDLVGLPLFDAKPSEWKLLVSFYQKLVPLLQAQGKVLKVLRFTGVDGWQVQLDSGCWVRLGFENELQRLQVFLKAYPILMGQNKGKHIVYADMRYKKGFSVKWG